MITLADAEAALIHNAEECESCLRLAELAATVPALGKPSARGLRNYARLYSEEAFELSRTIVRLRGAR